MSVDFRRYVAGKARTGMFRLGTSLLALVLLSGCAMVTVKSRGSADYIAVTRGDVLSTGALSQSGRETLGVAGLEEKTCRQDIPACVKQLDAIPELDGERRLSAESELWVAQAQATAKANPSESLDAWLHAARSAYAYLFYTSRTPGERAFENRQTQVRDYYNYAVGQVGGTLFQRWHAALEQGEPVNTLVVGDWTLGVDMGGFRLPGDAHQPESLVAADALHFVGVRSVYRRDGFGAEFVAKVSPLAVGDPSGLAKLKLDFAEAEAASRNAPDFSEMPYAPVTLLLKFEGDSLQAVERGHTVRVMPYDPYRQMVVSLHAQRVPLAGNFTAPYGLWLAESGFAAQSIRSMLGLERGIDRPHLYLMQPFDPNRRILLMLHGLASSPEAWVNLANEIMGDEALREHYQIWQVYYPTNAPIPINRARIATLVEQTLARFDPSGTAPASRHMVLVGHSMGGVIGRLLLSSSGEQVWNKVMARRDLSPERARRVREKLGPLLHFEPLPQVDRAIFLAAPQRGTPMAESRLGRLIGKLVRLPLTLLEGFGDVLQDLAGGGDAGAEGDKVKVPTAIDNLRDTDPFIRATADLPISPRVRYHVIVGKDDELPLADSSDGVVPYRSAHMGGAESEKVIKSWHSVQEKPEAILEIRRILHEQMASENGG